MSENQHDLIEDPSQWDELLPVLTARQLSVLLQEAPLFIKMRSVLVHQSSGAWQKVCAFLEEWRSGSLSAQRRAVVAQFSSLRLDGYLDADGVRLASLFLATRLGEAPKLRAILALTFLLNRLCTAYVPGGALDEGRLERALLTVPSQGSWEEVLRSGKAQQMCAEFEAQAVEVSCDPILGSCVQEFERGEGLLLPPVIHFNQLGLQARALLHVRLEVAHQRVLDSRGAVRAIAALHQACERNHLFTHEASTTNMLLLQGFLAEYGLPFTDVDPEASYFYTHDQWAEKIERR